MLNTNAYFLFMIFLEYEETSMSLEDKYTLTEEFDQIKGIANRLYAVSDVAAGFFQGVRSQEDPKTPVYGVGSGAGEHPIGGPSPITAGIYWRTPEPLLDAAIKSCKILKQKKDG